MRIIEDARKVSEEAKAIDGLDLQVQEISALPCKTGEKLLRYYTPSPASYHIRHTLDRSYYASLQQTHLRERDQDQAVERYSRRQKGNFWADPRIIMVDQLWLWVLGESRLIHILNYVAPQTNTTHRDRPYVLPR